MRSWRECVLGAVLVAACGTEPTISETRIADDGGDLVPVDPDACATSFLTYENFGGLFVSSWCRGCHSSALPDGMRQKAPAAVNFDDADQVRTWGPRIAVRAASVEPTMPPAGGPTDEERALLAEWITCGAR
jgi:uncharacterized membrane protein